MIQLATHADQAMDFYNHNRLNDLARWDERHLVGVIDETVTVYDDGSVFALWPSEQDMGSPRVYETVLEFRKHNPQSGVMEKVKKYASSANND